MSRKSRAISVELTYLLAKTSKKMNGSNAKKERFNIVSMIDIFPYTRYIIAIQSLYYVVIFSC